MVFNLNVKIIIFSLPDIETPSSEQSEYKSKGDLVAIFLTWVGLMSPARLVTNYQMVLVSRNHLASSSPH